MISSIMLTVIAEPLQRETSQQKLLSRGCFHRKKGSFTGAPTQVHRCCMWTIPLSVNMVKEEKAIERAQRAGSFQHPRLHTKQPIARIPLFFSFEEQMPPVSIPVV